MSIFDLIRFACDDEWVKTIRIKLKRRRNAKRQFALRRSWRETLAPRHLDQEPVYPPRFGLHRPGDTRSSYRGWSGRRCRAASTSPTRIDGVVPDEIAAAYISNSLIDLMSRRIEVLRQTQASEFPLKSLVDKPKIKYRNFWIQ
ncbi:hypothetical protein [Burkholderia cepacia]|uniref:hypothetical protein n=1 Tax=Burkholderia cepacia TaxID=292 RepID=UPI00158E0A7F|nr:hypothetical protein [Burkholderia cepacia]